MVDFEYKSSYDVEDLRGIVKILRGEGGCPWDREQTHESIRRDFLEETYEVVEAIDQKSTEHLLEELGDVLLQVVFHADIEDDAGTFNLDDVADGVCKKLILRHPHVFGDVKVADSAEVLKNWDDIKRKEKNQGTVTSAMDSVARSLPALWRAEKIQKKAAKVGFDWESVDGALDKVAEEANELREAVKSGSGEAEELGDLLFSAVNVARFMHADPEEALHGACEKFLKRFSLVEKMAQESGRQMKDMTLSQLDELWDEAKKQLC